MAEGGALLHSCAVYLYVYDSEQGSYSQQTDAAVGCALLAGEAAASHGGGAFSLLLYDTQKTSLLQLPVTPSARFTPQKDNYVNFYDRAQQRNYAMRFKDAATSEAFLSAVAFTKAQVLVHANKSYDESRGTRPVVLVDQLAMGKEDAAPLTFGDVAGITLQKWQGTAETRSVFFSTNPLEIGNQQTAEETTGGEVRRVRLIEGDADAGEADPFVRVLASEALVGMQKTAKRLVTVIFPHTHEWMIALVELVKVKKNTRASASSDANPTPVTAAAAPAAAEEDPQSQENHDNLVKRMASLSQMGSQTSGLIASVKTRLDRRTSMEANGGEAEVAMHRSSSVGQQSDPPAGYVPVLLAGLQLPGDRPGSFRSSALEQSSTHAPPQPAISSSSISSASSLAAKVIEPLKHSAGMSNSDVGISSLGSLSSDMDRLMKEQSDLARQREQLEESKRQLESDNSLTSEPAPLSRAPSAANGVVGNSANSKEYRPGLAKPGASYTPSSFALLGPTASSLATTSTYGSTAGRWTPSNLDLVPAFSSSAFAPPSQIPPAMPSVPAPFPTSLTPYNNRSFPAFSSTPGAATGTGASVDVENGIVRLQRSSTSIESTLQDLQSKMDRLLNSQNSIKSGKFASSSGKYGGSSAFSASASVSSSSSSSSMLLKNLEKALTQRDQLQELNTRLQDANGELESNVEDLQSQHESLQLENRTLLDKLQNGNHLQQEKFRLELRSVQQQLSNTQEQMLVYQEQNFQLRSELAAKDEQLSKEKARLQEDARKQLEQLQHQVQEEVRQGSKDSVDKMAAEKRELESQVAELTAQKRQWELERDAMTSKLHQAQSQHVQMQDETVKSQAAQDSRVQELLGRVQQLESESVALKQQADGFHSEAQQLEELLASKELEMTRLQTAKNDQEYAALSELFKEFMNDIYFHFQDAFDEDTEFTGKEIVMAIRKILKQNTMDILTKLEEFYQLQAQHRQQ
ncbi:hypothetical protein BBJ28_00002402 [Nothophytophthora sp. Chile5]|nr:hypothetical protein BBJ28_00002402 [Nothophytophthora sp. Chile5]